MPNIYLKNFAGSTCNENEDIFKKNRKNHLKYKYITSFNTTTPNKKLSENDTIIEIVPKSLIKMFKKFKHAYISKSIVKKIYRGVTIRNLDIELKDESPEFRNVIKNELEEDNEMHIIMVEWKYFDDIYECNRIRIPDDPTPRSWGQILSPDNKVYNEILQKTE